MASTNLQSLKKVVNIMVPADNASGAANTGDVKPSPPSSNASYSPPRRPLKSDDVLFAAPTFSERCMRYLMVVIYLGGLSSLGFFLSIYYIFFWDSRMPPVYKPAKKSTVFMKP